VLYTWLIFYIVRQWEAQAVVIPSGSFIPQIQFSVLVAARNEERNIVETVSTILSCHYPKDLFEVIVIDDHSIDNTIEVLAQIQDDRISIIELQENTGKKAALSLGINHAKFSHIVVTDADCLVPTNWLQSFAFLFEDSKAKFIAGPVIINDGQDALSTFQSLDTIGTVGATQSGIQSKRWYMANGASMAFLKEPFIALSGFEENKNWASGDDMFLVERFSQLGQVAYLKTPYAVITKAESSWSDLYQQRIRWATKNRSYNHQGVRNTLSIVFLFNFFIVLAFFLAIIYGSKWLTIALTMLTLKIIVDRLYLNKMTEFFDKIITWRQHIVVTFIYMVYIVGVGFTSLVIKKYTWKGRRVQ
jgi:glycosyltransferase involved in cell wall biosynthesis